jgi:hypothetical protein
VSLDLGAVARGIMVAMPDEQLAAAARGLPDDVLAGMLREAIGGDTPTPKVAKVRPKLAQKREPKPKPTESRPAKPHRGGGTPIEEVIAEIKSALAKGKLLGVKALAEATQYNSGQVTRAVSFLARAGELAHEGTIGTRACRWRLA